MGYQNSLSLGIRRQALPNPSEDENRFVLPLHPIVDVDAMSLLLEVEVRT